MDDSIHTKLDKINEKLGSMNVIIAKQEVNIANHIRRTEIIELELEPVKRHVQIVHGVMQVVGLLSVVVSIFAGVAKLFELI